MAQVTRIGIFDGVEEKWKEWATKFKGAVKEADPRIFDCLRWAEGEFDESDDANLPDELGEWASSYSTCAQPAHTDDVRAGVSHPQLCGG